MRLCCVESCDVTSEDTFYFEFPTSRLLRRKWLKVIQISGKLPLGAVVCSRHFGDGDYENVRGKVRLKSKVVPSRMLDEVITTEPSETPQKSSESQSKSTTPPPKSLKTPPKSPTPPSKSPKSPPKVQDLCDSTTVSVPSPIDAEKLIDDIQNERERDKGSISTEAKAFPKVLHKENGRTSDADTMIVKSPVLPDPKEDIEDMITNYHIKNKVPNPALLADLVPINDIVNGDIVQESNILLHCDEPIEIEDANDVEPVFIEVSVDKDKNTTEAESQDCLMLLESVQVDIDPTSLLLDQDDYYPDDPEEPDEVEEVVTVDNRRNDAISLLTSSDEDDVIIEEPNIDTVEVSDETDEDDMPLVKLVKTKAHKKRLDRIIWGTKNCDFYCMKCNYTTINSEEYHKHVAEHSKVLQVCQICGLTTASKNMFERHMRVHKNEKKFECHLCSYRARHQMSLLYHLKNHDSEKLNSAKSVKKVKRKKDFMCRKCGFKSKFKSRVATHVRQCRSKTNRFFCDKCDYSTKKRSDLKRHHTVRHKKAEERDEDYMPKT